MNILHQDLPPCQVEALLSFHAITGCDSVSQLAAHGKTTTWKVFQTHNQLLTDLGTEDWRYTSNVEQFTCHLYKVPDDVNTCDKARVILVSKGCP